jgi:Na+-driven multidrug efflux pump
MRVAMKASYIYILIFVLPLSWLLGPWLAEVLSDTPATRGYAAEGMPFLSVAVIAGTPFFLSRSIFDGLQKPRPGFLASMIRTFLFFIPCMTLGYYLARVMKVSPMLGLCGGTTLALALGSRLISGWLDNFLRIHSAMEDMPNKKAAE